MEAALDARGGERFVFVGGAPRSGTTLTQNMLDCHPEIVGGPEFLNLDYLVGVRNRMQGFIARGMIDVFCSAPEADRLFAQLIGDLLLPLADRQGVRFLSEKSPTNVLVFDELLDLFPAARCIFVLRDPRAIVASMLESGIRADSPEKRAKLRTLPWACSLPHAIAHVRRCFERGFAAADRRPDRVHIVTYEGLVTDPEAETRRLCAFLDIPWTDAMLSPSRKAHLGEKPLTSGTDNLFYSSATFGRDPDPAGLHRWKTRLNARQRGQVTLSLADMPRLAAYGYELAPGRLSGPEYALGQGGRLLERARRRVLWSLGSP